MFKLSLATGLIFMVVSAFAQSPHGKELKLDCTRCHTDENWLVNQKQISFDHDSTDFALLGQHKNVNCKDCHSTLIFSEAKKECDECHTDMHQQTVGTDCARCHNNNSWVVTTVTQIHQEGRFPLLGAHKSADCSACHQSASTLQFNSLGTECFDCHKANYYATTSPNHVQAGYSTNCDECHSIFELEWTAKLFSHDFFPLTQGHSTPSCTDCHGDAPFQKVSANCFDCHEFDYITTKSPNHQSLGFSTECTSCHTLSPGWQPADYTQHDAENFPIYSGKHRGVWDNCSTCHTNASDYSAFSCTDCHEHSRLLMNSEHNDVGDYTYESSACYSCHPRGREED